MPSYPCGHAICRRACARSESDLRDASGTSPLVVRSLRQRHGVPSRSQIQTVSLIGRLRRPPVSATQAFLRETPGGSPIRLSHCYANVCTITGPATAVAGPKSRGARFCSIQASARRRGEQQGSPRTELSAVLRDQSKRPGIAAGPFLLLCSERLDLEVHTTHAAHAATARRHAASTCVLLRNFSHHGFGGDQESRNRSRVLDRGADHLGRVDDALGDQVAVLAGLAVEAVGVLILLQDLADDDGAVLASVDRDLARRI